MKILAGEDLYNALCFRPSQHTRQPSVTEAADAHTVAARKRARDEQHAARRKDAGAKTTASNAGNAFDWLSASATVTREKNVPVDGEIKAFAGLVMDVRSRFRFDEDVDRFNEGYVIARKMRSRDSQEEKESGEYPSSGTSVKCVVHCGGSSRAKRKSAFNFTCDRELWYNWPSCKHSF